MAWPTYTADVTQNSNQIKLYGAVPASDIPVGDEVIVYGTNVIANLEVAGGTAIMYDGEGSPYSYLSLARPYTGQSSTGVEVVIKPTGSQARDIVEIFRNGTNQLNQSMANFNQFVEGTDPIQHQPLDQNAEPLTIKTLQGMQSEFEGQLSQQQEDVNDLLANKAADGNDTTPGALLAVGATVKQLDTANSNIEYKPSVPPTLRADFKNQKYTLYTDADGYKEVTFEEMFSFSRSTTTTKTSPTGKIVEVGIDKPVSDFEGGDCLGLRVTQGFTNAITWSEDFTNSVWTKRSGSDVESNVLAAPDGTITVDRHYNTDTTTSGSYIRRHLSEFGGVPADTVWCAGMHVARGSQPTSRITLYGKNFSSDASRVTVQLNHDTGAVTTESEVGQMAVIDSGLIKKRDGTYFLWVSANFGSGQGNGFIDFIPSVWDLPAYVDSEYGYIWGAQLTEGSYPFPYQKTEASVVDVEADTVSRVLADEFNSNAFTLVAEVDSKNADLTPVLKLNLSTDGAQRGLAIFASSAEIKTAIRTLQSGFRSSKSYSRGTATIVITLNKTEIISVINESVETISLDPTEYAQLVERFESLLIGGNLSPLSGNLVGNDSIIKLVEIYPVALPVSEAIQLSKRGS